MKLKLQLIIESDSGETELVQEVTKLERHSLRPENLGLTLSEAKWYPKMQNEQEMQIHKKAA